MAKQSAPVVERTIGHNVGIAAAEALDAELDVVTGFRAARDPELVEKRRAYNVAKRQALTATLLAELEQ